MKMSSHPVDIAKHIKTRIMSRFPDRSTIRLQEE